MPASELVSSTKASSSMKSSISLWRSSASSVMSESAVEKVGEGVRSARRSFTQPWKIGELGWDGGQQKCKVVTTTVRRNTEKEKEKEPKSPKDRKKKRRVERKT